MNGTRVLRLLEGTCYSSLMNTDLNATPSAFRVDSLAQSLNVTPDAVLAVTDQLAQTHGVDAVYPLGREAGYGLVPAAGPFAAWLSWGAVEVVRAEHAS